MAKQKQLDEVRPILTEVDHGVTAVEKGLDAVDRGADKVTSVVESGLETVADVVPEALDTAVHVTTAGTRRLVGVFRSPKTLAVAILLLGAGAGSIAGYQVAKRRLTKHFEEKLEGEIEGMRVFYERRYKTGDFASPQEAAEALGVKEAVEALQSYETPKGQEEISDEDLARLKERLKNRTEEPSDEQVIEAGNIFRDGVPVGNWDIERELLLREAQPDAPYVISFDEHAEGKGYEQISMTYFEKDEILADPNDVPVEEVEATVGLDNLQRFGHGSNDINIVYVRNDRIELDIEIARSTGAYGEEVTGFIEHSEIPNRRRAGKGRRRDDGE